MVEAVEALTLELVEPVVQVVFQDHLYQEVLLIYFIHILIFILVDQSVHVGDIIEVEGQVGERLQLAIDELQRNTREIQESVMSMRMLPVNMTFNRFPRVVRDLSSKLGKKVDLVIQGGNTEIDKSLIEKLVDPLTHLVRNSIDHGIESPEKRLEAGKAPDFTQVIWLSEASEPPTSWAELRACNATELECWRNKQGWPLGDQELTGDTNPFELGLSDWVELNKGCYLGQETVAKLASRGGVKQQLRCWQSTSQTQKSLESGEQLKLNDSRAGIITSVSTDKATGSSFGLALVRRQALDAETLQVGDSDVEVSIARPSAFCDPPARG